MNQKKIRNIHSACDVSIPIIKPTLFDPEEIIEEMRDFFTSGCVTVCKYVKKFEDACAQYLGVKHVVAVSSCTSGLMLAVKALGLCGEVIVPSFTFTATVHSLCWNGIKPVFVDCRDKTFTIDVSKIKEKITQKTSGIMPVCIFGNPPEVGALQSIAEEHHLKVIYDSAQAFGAEYNGRKVGGFGDCEVFSLSPTKVLTALEGGLITTNNDAVAEFIRKGRDYGKGVDDIDFIGLSARMSEAHALVGLHNLKKINTYYETRKKCIALYKKLLSGVKGISFQEPTKKSRSSLNYMVIVVDKEGYGFSRDELYEILLSEGIQTKKYFYPAVHLQRAYSQFSKKYEGKLPMTEKASGQILALPLYGDMKEDIVQRVCSVIRKIYTKK